MQKKLTDYEKAQNFNKMIAYIHSIRFKRVIKIFTQLEKNRTTPINVLEIGTANGKLYEILDKRFSIKYVGIEINSKSVEVVKERYSHKDNFKIIHDSVLNVIEEIKKYDIDVIIALETLEHIPERLVVRLMEQFALTKAKLFLFSVPVEVGPIIWIKNISSFLMGYYRHKQYTLKETFWASIYKLYKLPPHHQAEHKGFDWRWLAQTIHQNLEIKSIQKFPFKWLPAALANSLFFIVKKRSKAQ